MTNNKTLLEIFNNLTEIEIKASVDSAKDNPEYNSFANIYILAVERCREILEIILEGTDDKMVNSSTNS